MSPPRRSVGPHWGTRGLLVVSLGLVVLSAVLDLAPITGVAALVMFAGLLFTIVHGQVALGGRNLIAFMLITVLISFAAETIGVATGVVFGDYHYTDELGPKLLGVPLVIPIAYTAMAYASLTIARAVLGVESGGGRPLAVALAGAIAMVGWDVAMDPGLSTVHGDWIWEQAGGPYFGVGIHNYIGWFCTVFAFMTVYGLWERRNPIAAPTGVAASRLFASEPVLFYVVIALGIVATPVIGATPESLAVPQNYSGSISDLNASMALVACFTMGGPAAFALLRIWNRHRAESRPRRQPTAPRPGTS